MIPEVELERSDFSLFFTFVSAPIVVARNLEGIWHVGELNSSIFSRSSQFVIPETQI